MKNIKAFLICAMLVLLAVVSCKEEEQVYDINWPVPEITGISPAKQMIDNNISISGNNFTKITRIWVGDTEVQEENIVSKSETEIVIKVPRAVNGGPITLENIYEKRDVSEDSFLPEYPVTEVLSWPTQIERGKSFKIEGDNVDLITKIQIGGNSINFDGSKGSSSAITVQTTGLDLSADKVTVAVLSAKGGLKGSTVAMDIPVVEAGAFFDAKDPLVLWDFEDGVNPYSGEGTSSINGGNVPKGRGMNYLHIEGSDPNSWHTYGLITAQEVDPGAADFTDPHISFLINTGDKEGYFHMQVIQGATTYESHFNNAPDDYKFKTTGWEWRSYTLDPTSENAGEWKAQGFDPSLPFTMQLEIRNGNIGTGLFEVNLDQVMITDGPVNVVQTLFDFEDGTNPYSGSANAGINQSGIATIRGDKYLTVTKPTVAKYEWTGEITYSTPVDLGDIQRPYLNVWVNTNGNNGNIQIETTQGDTKWGSDPFAAEGYTINTDGWKLYSFEMTQLFTSNWNSGSASAFDPKGIMDYIKIGFSSGNQETGVYEVNVDQISISDGPMF